MIDFFIRDVITTCFSMTISIVIWYIYGFFLWKKCKLNKDIVNSIAFNGLQSFSSFELNFCYYLV